MKRTRLQPPLKPIPGRLALAWLICTAGLAGCADRMPLRGTSPMEQLRGEMNGATRNSGAVAGAAAAAPAAPAAAPALRIEPAPEPRFDLVVNGAQARDVFLAMVTDTPYSMLMHPEVGGTISVTLRGVTVREALESIRDVYGYDFKVEGRRITVFPPTMQMRIFTLNYLNTKRQGRSDMRVSSGSAPVNPTNGSSSGSTPSPSNSPTAAPESSQISSSSSTDIWTETTEALRSLIGNGAGRSVITSPQAGTIAVRAMPDELRQVEGFLRASRLAIERQVMLEAKLVEVELREGFQSGIDWSILKSKGAAGQTSGYPNNPLLVNSEGLPTLPSVPQAIVNALAIDSVSLPAGASGTLGLALATNGFQAVLGFLETHGDLQILSSPRVATLNNQKAVLKVGTDDYFVTNVSGGTINNNVGINNNGGETTLPTLTLTPFFSGIALDVTPQIDDADTITLHIHPSVTAVTEKIKRIDLGRIGTYQLPLASSAVNETDTMVRVRDGNIVAIGGLMQMESNRSDSGLPGARDNSVTRELFSNRSATGRKKELVVLIKPTIIRSAEEWQRSTEQEMAALEERMKTPRRVVTVNASSPTDAPAKP